MCNLNCHIDSNIWVTNKPLPVSECVHGVAPLTNHLLWLRSLITSFEGGFDWLLSYPQTLMYSQVGFMEHDYCTSATASCWWWSLLGIHLTYTTSFATSSPAVHERHVLTSGFRMCAIWHSDESLTITEISSDELWRGSINWTAQSRYLIFATTSSCTHVTWKV